MEKKCSMCGETKNVKEFRYMSAKRRYCAYCRQCEVFYNQKYRESNKKDCKKRQLKKNFRELCELMDQCEFDNLIFNFKEIYREVQQGRQNE